MKNHNYKYKEIIGILLQDINAAITNVCWVKEKYYKSLRTTGEYFDSWYYDVDEPPITAPIKAIKNSIVFLETLATCAPIFDADKNRHLNTLIKYLKNGLLK